VHLVAPAELAGHCVEAQADGLAEEVAKLVGRFRRRKLDLDGGRRGRLFWRRRFGDDGQGRRVQRLLGPIPAIPTVLPVGPVVPRVPGLAARAPTAALRAARIYRVLNDSAQPSPPSFPAV
jgi:hypothetical protein